MDKTMNIAKQSFFYPANTAWDTNGRLLFLERLKIEWNGQEIFIPHSYNKSDQQCYVIPRVVFVFVYKHKQMKVS